MPEQRRVNGDARMHEWKKPERNKQENATTTKKKRSRETTTAIEAPYQASGSEAGRQPPPGGKVWRELTPAGPARAAAAV
jgi:hypothetical protein